MQKGGSHNVIKKERGSQDWYMKWNDMMWYDDLLFVDIDYKSTAAKDRELRAGEILDYFERVYECDLERKKPVALSKGRWDDTSPME